MAYVEFLKRFLGRFVPGVFVRMIFKRPHFEFRAYLFHLFDTIRFSIIIDENTFPARRDVRDAAFFAEYRIRDVIYILLFIRSRFSFVAVRHFGPLRNVRGFVIALFSALGHPYRVPCWSYTFFRAKNPLGSRYGNSSGGPFYLPTRREGQ